MSVKPRVCDCAAAFFFRALLMRALSSLPALFLSPLLAANCCGAT